MAFPYQEVDAYAEQLALYGEGDQEVDEDNLNKKDAVLFAIDATLIDDLFQQTYIESSPSTSTQVAGHDTFHPMTQAAVTKTSSPFQEIMSTVFSFMKTKVVQSGHDKIGLMFYGTRETKNGLDFNGIYEVQELDEPDGNRIREIGEMMNWSKDEFKQKIGSKKESSFSSFLWLCSSTFLSSDPLKFYRRVFIFSTNDSPCASSKDRQASYTRAKDCHEANVELELFPFELPGKPPFDIDKFWSKIVFLDPDSDFVEISKMRLEELRRRVRSKTHNKRTMAKTMMRFGQHFQLSVNVYCQLLEQKIPPAIKLRGDDFKITSSSVTYRDANTGAVLHPETDIQSYYELGGEKVFISKQELTNIRKTDDPGFDIVGFADKSVLSRGMGISHPYFLYPDETRIEGSVSFFSTMLHRMAAKDKICLCRFTLRKDSPCSLAALIPQVEEVDTGIQVRPPGFQVVILPFADDIRQITHPNPSFTEEERAEIDQAKEKMKSVLTSMTAKHFDPLCIENPALQRHWSAVQALALEEDQPEKTEDLLTQNADVWGREQIQKDLKDFATICYGEAGHASMTGTKRKAPAAKRAANKVPKIDADSDITNENLKKEIQQDTLKFSTVAAIKAMCKVRGIKTTGNKATLMDRLKEHLGI